ncbi:hypothetical protein LTR16_007084, partial [Cryomyces antarcticus]
MAAVLTERRKRWARKRKSGKVAQKMEHSLRSSDGVDAGTLDREVLGRRSDEW